MSTEETAEDRPEDALGRCLGLLRDGGIAEADRLAGEGLRIDPDDGHLWQLRGLIRQRLGDFDGALEALEAASLLVPLSPPSRCVLADCYARSGRAALARDLYRHLGGDPRCPTALLPMVAAGLGGLGDFEAALEACRELIRRAPGQPEAHFGVAFYLRRLGYPPEAALPSIARAHELDPDAPLYRVTLASLLAEAGEIEEAYDLLRGVDPRSVGCRCCLRRMGAIFLRASDADRAGACRDRADRLGDGYGAGH